MNIENVFINYIDYGKKDGVPLVFLHGWGQNIEMMRPLANAFKHAFRIIVIDLPGFGNSSEPDYVYSYDDYTRVINALLGKLNVSNPVMIGHSFGGSVALKYASNYNIRKLILLASPYKKSKITLKTKVLKKLANVKMLKGIVEFAKKKVGSTDYKNASGVMREIMVKKLSYDLTEDARKINVPTLIIWGRMDEAVSINDGIALEKIIPDAGLVIYDRCTHYAYLEDLQKTISVFDKFLEKESRGNLDD